MHLLACQVRVTAVDLMPVLLYLCDTFQVLISSLAC